MKSNIWNHEETVLFISLCKDNKDLLFNPKYKKVEIYKEIAKKMQENGHSFTPEQCVNKMKSLIAKYKEIKDYNAQSGNNLKEWQYLDLMADYVGDRPGITPVACCSSLSMNKVVPINNKMKSCDPSSSKRSEASTSDENKSQRSEAKTSDENKSKKVCQRPSPRNEMVKWLQEYKKDVEDREKKRLKIVEKQHTENKELLSEILNLLKTKNGENN